MLSKCVMQQHGLPEWHHWFGHGNEAALAAMHPLAVDDTYADQAELSNQMMGDKIERPTVQGQHYNSLRDTCTVCLGGPHSLQLGCVYANKHVQDTLNVCPPACLLPCALLHMLNLQPTLLSLTLLLTFCWSA